MTDHPTVMMDVEYLKSKHWHPATVNVEHWKQAVYTGRLGAMAIEAIKIRGSSLVCIAGYRSRVTGSRWIVVYS